MSDALKLDRPFAVFFDVPSDDMVKGQWTAHVVGFQLDNITCGYGPLETAYMAFDMLCCLAEVDPDVVIAKLKARIAEGDRD